MKLSYKQIAVFGQVKVDIKPLGSKVSSYTTLLKLYKDGWWVTDRIGTIITIVKPKPILKYGFHCLCRHISTTINLDTIDALTKPYAEIKYQQYKDYLNKNIVRNYEMPNMQQGNNNVLRQTSGRTDSKVSRKCQRPRFHGKKKKDSTKIIP